MKRRLDFFVKNYELVWGEKYSTLMVDMFARVAISHPDIMGNDIADYVSCIKNRELVKAYYSESVLYDMKKKHGRYFLKKHRIKELVRSYVRLFAAYDKIISEYSKYNFEKLTDNELLKLFERYVEFSERVFAHFRLTREEGEIVPTEKIIKVLERHYKKNEVGEIFQIITQSPAIDVIGEERTAWLRIIETKWDEIKVRKYIMKFAANFVNMHEIPAILKYLEKRYSRDKKYLEQIKKEIANNKKQKRELILKQKEIYKKCQYDKNLVDFSQMIQLFGPYRFKLKYCWAGIELHLFEFFAEIRRRMGVTTKDFFDLYTINDVIRFFETGKQLTNNELKKRKECIVIHIKDKNYFFYSGKEALDIANAIEYVDKRESELKGMVAFPGRVKGKIKVVHSTDIEKMSKIADKFNAGDILVCENTQPAMIVFMKKSSAVLTEQGGLTSHASIVSREFKKPCIVGVKGLLKTLKDGDLVEVDAEKGTIKKIR